jgi:hypothetical protein
MHGNIPDDQISRLARGFIRQYGTSAPELVMGEERKALRDGDLRGAAICRRLSSEIEKLLALEPISLMVH